MDQMDPETQKFLQEHLFHALEEQMEANDPPVTKETYDRLINEGIEKEDVMKLLASVLITELHTIAATSEPFNLERYTEWMHCLPDQSFLDDPV